MSSSVRTACLLALLGAVLCSGAALAQSPDPQAAPQPSAQVSPDKIAPSKVFGVRNIAFVLEKPAGYGAYKKRPAPVFAPNELLQFYAEPVNLGWSSTGGSYRFNMIVDVEVRRPDGEILWGRRGMGHLLFESTQPRSDTFISGSVMIKNLPVGSYVLGVRFRDPANNKVVERDLAFDVAKPKGQDA